MDDKIKNVAILGTGLIGASWAAFYAGKGFGVKIYDADKSQCDLGYKKAVEYLTHDEYPWKSFWNNSFDFKEVTVDDLPQNQTETESAVVDEELPF